MFCTKCGANLLEGAAFCSSCGAQLGNRGNVAVPAQAANSYAPAQVANPYARGNYVQAASPYGASGQYGPYGAPGASVVQPTKKKSIIPLIAGAAIVVIAAVVGIGFATGLIGLPFGGGGPVYALVSSTNYDGSGIVVSETTYKLDDAGNVVKQVQNQQSAGVTFTYTYDYDEFGHATKQKSTTKASGQTNSTSLELENTLDKQNRLVSGVGEGDGSSSAIEYEYYDNGTVKSCHCVLSSDGSDQEQVLDRTYDEKGLQTSFTLKVIMGGEVVVEARNDFDWNLDSKGRPESVEVTQVSSGTEWARTFDVECDDEGNIVALMDEDGNVVVEYTYEKIDKPSVGARARASIFTMS